MTPNPTQFAVVVARRARGHRPPNYRDRTGKVYGKWRALEPHPTRYYDGSVSWLCERVGNPERRRVIPAHKLREYAISVRSTEKARVTG